MLHITDWLTIAADGTQQLQPRVVCSNKNNCHSPHLQNKLDRMNTHTAFAQASLS